MSWGSTYDSSYPQYDTQYNSQYMQRSDSGYASVASPTYSGGYDTSYGYKSEYSPMETDYPSHSSSSSSRPAYPCLYPGCTVKPFNRSADMGRHVQQVHNDKASKKSFSCDYSRCLRKGTEPFYRKDHFRDHLRDYHKEDLGKRTVKGSAGGSKSDSLGLAGTNISASWWRCSRCLTRNDVPDWECRNEGCGTTCERERREARLNMR